MADVPWRDPLVGSEGLLLCQHMNDDCHVTKKDAQQVERGEIKRVGKSGQISLGKRYAGKTFSVRHRSDGSLLLTAVAMVPESLLWTLQEPHRSAILKGMTWASSAPPAETDLDALMAEAKEKGKRGHKALRRTLP
jgi:putative transposon-encoded protein